MVQVLAENPLFPPEFDWAWQALILLITGFMLAALYDIMQLRKATFLKALEWVALVVAVPVVGPAIWFTVGRTRFED